MIPRCHQVILNINMRIGTVTLALLVMACTTPASTQPSPAADALRVVVTTTVLADLVGNVGGSDAEIVSLVPKGGEVHTFDPTPSDLTEIAEADLVVMNGLGLDAWLRQMVEDSGSGAPVVELAEDLDGVTYLAGDEHKDDEPEEGEHPDESAHTGEDGAPGEAVNPHLWLNVEYTRLYVDRIAEALATADAEDAATYQANARVYGERLAALDAEIRGQIDSIPEASRRIVSFHEAYPYYAEAYGLEVVGTIVDAPGQDPSAGEIADLVDAIRASGAKAVFTEAQFSPDLAETVAAEAGVKVVRDLYNDSLGDPPLDSYEAMMRWNTSQTVEALR